MVPTEVFLSHSSIDARIAIDLASVLQRHGIPVWYSATSIVGAQQWQDQIGAALQRCDWFVLVLSPQSAQSMWVKRELAYALSQNRLVNRIVPVIIQPTEIEKMSWTLTLYQMVDFTESFTHGCRNLLRIWGVGYRPNY